MKKWIERLITAAGIAILVGIFCYQVAYGTTAIITAPNEAISQI